MSGASTDNSFPSVDGRSARRDRNRESVVDALLELYGEGHMRPSLDLVAQRSGVSHRSVFRYFEDLNELDRVAIERFHERCAHLFEIPALGEGSLSARIERLVDQRLILHDATAPVARVARMRAPTHPVLAENIVTNREVLRRQVAAHFAVEFELHEPTTVLAISALISMETIDLMRSDHGSTRVRSALIDSLTRLLSPRDVQ
ncbi:MAG: TetR/AcrR family transcriptional regulator [Acidimicrobiales bacterium]|nr:TetR/AcrR family transcriptional regulator [Acidimicrobiales bacterium]